MSAFVLNTLDGNVFLFWYNLGGSTFHVLLAVVKDEIIDLIPPGPLTFEALANGRVLPVVLCAQVSFDTVVASFRAIVSTAQHDG